MGGKLISSDMKVVAGDGTNGCTIKDRCEVANMDPDSSVQTGSTHIILQEKDHPSPLYAKAQPPSPEAQTILRLNH